MSTHRSTVSIEEARRITTQTLQEMKKAETPVSMLTAYDYTSARILDQSGVDVILVGDSASNVMAGHETTLPITLDQMIYHASSVVRGVQRALVVVDLPFGSYQGNSKGALASAIRIMKESGAHAVKLEGGSAVIGTVERIITAGIPVMGHLGLTPQSIYRFGTYKVRAREKEEADQLKRDSLLLEQAGCFAIVLEKIPLELAAEVTRSLRIPTIGIGAGPSCDGQVLVTHDLLGLTTDFNPRFVRRYGHLASEIQSAVENYIQDVRSRSFPTIDESY
ncbi:MAG: 3-methyl-2-oxobutanoate hydroxymethyltransferase [Rhodothermales bacterium]|nr:3-methyl-2-oxobutanoate hydroxymethyltransferase [Rhodothermales bacterium]